MKFQREAGKVWSMHQEILMRFATGLYKSSDTLMIVTLTGNTTKTVLEWLLEWFPTLKGLLR